MMPDSARIKRFRGKALIEDNGHSLVKINIAACKPLPFIRYSPFGVLKRASSSSTGIGFCLIILPAYEVSDKIRASLF